MDATLDILAFQVIPADRVVHPLTVKSTSVRSVDRRSREAVHITFVDAPPVTLGFDAFVTIAVQTPAHT